MLLTKTHAWSRLFLILTFFILLASPLFAEETTVKNGNKITIEFTGTLEDGTVFDKAGPNDPPFTFVAGEGRLIPALENAILGMKLGEEKKITLQPDDAFGPYDPKRVSEVPREKLPPKPDPKPGMRLRFMGPDGSHNTATITAVKEQVVVLDMNHPLAGKVIVFQIKVVKIA